LYTSVSNAKNVSKYVSTLEKGFQNFSPKTKSSEVNTIKYLKILKDNLEEKNLI